MGRGSKDLGQHGAVLRSTPKGSGIMGKHGELLLRAGAAWGNTPKG